MTQAEEYEALVRDGAREAYRVYREDYPWAREWFEMPPASKERWYEKARAILTEVYRTLEKPTKAMEKAKADAPLPLRWSAILAASPLKRPEQ